MERSLRFDLDMLGEPQEWMVVHRGLEYPGQVIVAESVNPAWGRPLEGELCFRLVFYTVPRRIPPGQIRDPRIAIAVPRRTMDLAEETLAQELRSIHEAKERYVTSRDRETRALRNSMEDREASLRDQLTRRHAFYYSSGRIYTQVGMSLRARDLFTGGEIGVWADSLATAVLTEANPSLPFDHTEFPETLTTKRIDAMFRGLVDDDRQVAEGSAAFAVALGLADREAPTVFAPDRCRPMEIIRAEVEAHDGEMPVRQLKRLLCSKHGLNQPLSVFFILTFVHHDRAEIRLDPLHHLQLRGGGRLHSDRLSWDCVQEIDFPGGAGVDCLEQIRTRPPLVWNAVLPYADLLAEGLDLCYERDKITEQERVLLSALMDISRRVERSMHGLDALVAALGETAGGASTVLSGLRELCTATSYREFHSLAQGTFGGPTRLGRALDMLGHLESLSTLAPTIARTCGYLDEMTFGPAHKDLSLERDAIVGRLSLEALIATPSLWSSIEDGFQQMRHRYTATYIEHHSAYHEEAARLLYELQRLHPQVEAITRFDEIPELGGPFTGDVKERYTSLIASVRTCEVVVDDAILEGVPCCPACHLTLSESLPLREAGLVSRDVEITIREYNRRLGSEGVRRILVDPARGQVDKLVNLVQVGDVSALVNILDDDVVEFLHEFVTGEGS